MNDPANESDHDGTVVTWRIRQFEERGVAVLDRPIVFELVDAHGTALATVSIPSETMDELLGPHLAILAELQLDGSISLKSEFFSALSEPQAETDIPLLVSRALAPEMLEDEPNAEKQLKTLRKRLTEALTIVDQTLADLKKPVA